MKKFGLAFVLLPGSRAIFAMVALFMAALLIDALDSFGLEERSDAAYASSVDRVLSVFYGGNNRIGQNEITLIVIDQTSLDYLHEQGLTTHRSWPPDYELFSDLVEIAREYEPRAIFLDLYYGFPRADQDTIADYAGVLQSRPDIPILIGPVSDYPALAPLKDVPQTSLSAANEHIYALSDQDGLPRPAVALFNIICDQAPAPGCTNLPEGFFGKQLAINWGFGMSEQMAGLTPKEMLSTCEGGGIRQRLHTAATLLWFNMNKSLNAQRLDRRECFYFDTIPAAWLFAPPEGVDLDTFLKGRTLMVGSDLEWLADRFESPLLGVLPGVTWHAMALDNLLEGRGSVRVPPRKIILGIDALDIVEILLTLVALGLAIGSIYFPGAPWLSARNRMILVVGLCLIVSVLTFMFTAWPAANALAVVLMATGLLWVGKPNVPDTSTGAAEQGAVRHENAH